MLSPFRVARLVAGEEFDRLLNEVLMNGRPVSLGVRLRLSTPESLPGCALGLALRRLTELTWRAEPPALELADRLLALQRDDGSFGSVAASACAVAGLAALLAQSPEPTADARPPLPPEVSVNEGFGIDDGQRLAIAAAVARGLEWLNTQMPAFRGELVDVGEARIGVAVRRRSVSIEQVVDAAVLLWQLGSDRGALRRAGVVEPAALVDVMGLRHHRETAALVEPLLSREERRLPMGTRRAA
ncbi:MAG: hypothetical protein ACKVZJ_15375 [Phycisphaerales bacterium]